MICALTGDIRGLHIVEHIGEGSISSSRVISHSFHFSGLFMFPSGGSGRFALICLFVVSLNLTMSIGFLPRK